MTGEKNRFKTTEKLWDLDDKQLKSPVHDAMVLWLMDDNNLKALLYKHCEVVETVEYSEEDYQLNECLDVVINSISEKPIMSSKTFIAGYADLVVDFYFKKYISKEVCPIDKKWYYQLMNVKYFEDVELLLQEYFNDNSFKAKQFLSDDEGEYSEYKFIVDENGELDYCPYGKEPDIIKHRYPERWDSYNRRDHVPLSYPLADFWMNIFEEDFDSSKIKNWMKHGNRYARQSYMCNCLIEVKPYIDSFGAVLRQLNSYRNFYNQRITIGGKLFNTKFCIFTFDKRFDKQFESQGIIVLHPWTSKEDMLDMYGLR